MFQFIKKFWPTKKASVLHATKTASQLPNSAEEICRTAAFLFGQGRYLQALEHYQLAIKIDQHYAKAYRLIGYIYKEQNQVAEAETNLRMAISLDEKDADAYFMLGDIYKSQDKFAKARELLAKAYELDTENVYACKALIYCLHKSGDNTEALELTNLALQKYSNDSELHMYCGHIQSQLLFFNEAELSYKRALQARPDSIELIKYIAEIQYNQNKLAEAIANHEKILAIQPDNSEIRLAKGFCQLVLGNLADGFKNYQERYKLDTGSQLIPKLNCPLWDGNLPLKDKVLLIVAEQGYGDFIQFVRYTELIKQAGGSFILYVHKPIFELMQHSFGSSYVVNDLKHASHYDYYCSVMSLPYAFGTTLETIPKSIPYLRSNPELVEIWRDRLAPYSSRPCVGISWSGNRQFERDKFRSINLTDFIETIDSACNYIVLQTNISESELALLKGYPNVYLPGPLIQSFADTAAIMEICSYTISVDTAIIHLAGALGKPAHLLLPHVPDWRWLLDRSDNPWYPTVKLHRQDKLTVWANTIQRLKAELSA